MTSLTAVSMNALQHDKKTISEWAGYEQELAPSLLIDSFNSRIASKEKDWLTLQKKKKNDYLQQSAWKNFNTKKDTTVEGAGATMNKNRYRMR